jgi:hypothetical protein
VWLCIPRVLTTVHVDTASSGGENKKHELAIIGLKEANAFKKLVWAMKRRHTMTNRISDDTGRGGFMESLSSTYVAPHLDKGDSDSSVKNLLRDIRNELRENNQLLKSMTSNNQQQQITSSTNQSHADYNEFV